LGKARDPGPLRRNLLENVDLTLVLRSTEKASRDAEAAFDATQRLVVSVGARFDSIESRISTLESRMSGLQRRVASVENGIDGVGRSNHRIEGMLGDIFAKLGG
jgi:predicted  nucleic acid-binding Zn-ribbon protein